MVGLTPKIGIGIDLGTNYACVSVFRNGRVEIIPDEQGSRTMPSCVAFRDFGRLFGEAAKERIAIDPLNTVSNVKRLIGRRYNDNEILAVCREGACNLVEENGKPALNMNFLGEEKLFLAEEIAAMIICKLKEVAETYLGIEVTDAVISVPVLFNAIQKQGIRDAGTIAGLEVLRLISGPSAAAIAYNQAANSDAEKTVLFFDLGGGSLSVSVITLGDDIINVKAHAGDLRVGGEAFDDRLVAHCVKKYTQDYRKDPTEDAKAMHKLRVACESAKRILSSSLHARIRVEDFYEGDTFCILITRTCFEEMCADLFQSILTSMKKVIEKWDENGEDDIVDKSCINEIVLVGGSTRIPKIQNLLTEFFDGKNLNQTMNKDEAVASGLAIYSAVLGGCKDKAASEILLLDACSLPISIKTADGGMLEMFQGVESIPSKRTRMIATFVDNQSAHPMYIYEGETRLGAIDLTEIASGLASIEVTLDIDANGIIGVTAVNKETDREVKFTVASTGSVNCLSQSEIDDLCSNAKSYAAQDQAHRQKMIANNELEMQSINAKARLNEYAEQVRKKSCEVLEWLKNNQMADKQQYERQMEDLKPTHLIYMSV